MAKVLVVDDEPMICWSIRETLGAAGYEVVCAETAAEGLTLFRQVRPEAVFLDVRLPDADGLAILTRMKAERGPRTAVIVMTAFDECGTNKGEAMRLGASAYLSKPFNFDELDSIVRKALEGQPDGGWPGH